MGEDTTVRVKKDTRRLAEVGSKEETFYERIRHLVDSYKKNRWRTAK